MLFFKPPKMSFAVTDALAGFQLVVSDRTYSRSPRNHHSARRRYASQFMDRDARAHQGKAKITSRLCSIGGFDPDQWDLPPKPKWMRWKTYNRMVEKFDRYESMLEEDLLEMAVRLGLFRDISD